MSITYKEERLFAEEYIDFLRRTNLGSQYPIERFNERIGKLVNNVSISLVARNEENTIVGVLFGLTDFCYWLYVTDLGVDRKRRQKCGMDECYSEGNYLHGRTSAGRNQL